MYPLLFTTAFLMLMALFSSSELAHFQMSQLQSKLYESQLFAYQTSQEECSQARFEEENLSVKKMDEEEGGGEKKEERAMKEPHARSLDFMLTRPPNNSKLNFYSLLHNPKIKGFPEKFSFRESAAQLLRELYGKESFFQEIEKVEYRILDALLLVKEKSREFSYPDELASLELGDERLQKIFQKMLQGGADLPSLLDHITFDKEGTREDHKINFLFASEALLQAIFNDKQLVASLIEERNALWEKIKDQEKDRLEILQKNAMGRREIGQKTRTLVEETLQRHEVKFPDYKNLFEYTLGKKGTIFYVENPLTHTFTRQKL